MHNLPDLDRRLAARRRPARPHVMYQTWRKLLFLHWAVDPAVIQATLPAGLHVDSFAGRAYVGLVPFHMARIRPRWLPPLPWLSWFLETNVRTYVYDDDGRPGVWFYSLDANQPIAVWLARSLFRLPYIHAQMAARRRRDGWHTYRTQRTAQPAATFRFRPFGTPAAATPGSLDFFLVERYILLAQTRRGVRHGVVHHAPYQIQPATVTQWDGDLITRAGLPAPIGPPDHVCYANELAVEIFALSR